VTESEQHRIQCDQDREGLHAKVDDHETRLRLTEADLVEVRTKLAFWSGGGAIIGGLLTKLF
jgi:hypothetical protein